MDGNRYLWYQPSHGSEVMLHFKKLIWRSEAKYTHTNLLKSIISLYMKHM